MKMHLGRHALLTKQLLLVGKTVLYWVTDTLVLHKFSLKSFFYGKHIQLLCTCFEKCTEDLHLPASCKTDFMFWFCKSNKLWIAVCQGNSSPWVNWIIRRSWTTTNILTNIVTSGKESRPAKSGFLNSVKDMKNWKLLKLLCNDLVAFRM